MRAVVRWFVVMVAVAHGLVQVVGAAESAGLDVSDLEVAGGATATAGWLLAGVLAVSAGVMIAWRRPRWWWLVAGAAALVSQAMIATAWSDASAGTVANVVLVLAAGWGFAAHGPLSLDAEWRRRAVDAIAAAGPGGGPVVTPDELATLPAPVAAYARRSGAVGRPRPVSFLATIHGRIRGGPDAAWMPFRGRQLNTYGEHPRRLFFIEATKAGLPIEVLHVFDEEGATMRARLLGVVPIVDGRGPELDRSETVTLLNDLAVFAPAAALDADVRWSDAGERVARAEYRRCRVRVTADWIFDAAGDLVDFCTDDRSRASANGKAFTRQRWRTPLTGYLDLRGHRVATVGEAVWEPPAPEGSFSYLEFHIDDVVFDVVDVDGGARP